MKLSADDFPTDQHGWAEFLPLRRGTSEYQTPTTLTGTHRFPFVVIGAGFTGLACARRLAQLHTEDEILLLDARLVGQGASGRNSGFAVAVSQFGGRFKTSEMGNYERVNRINKAGLELLQAEVKRHKISCQWDGRGFHHTAADQSSLRECKHFLNYLEALGIAHTPLDRQALHDRLGTSHYQRGVHVHNGALLQPAMLVRGLADTLPENVTLHEQTPVLNIVKGSPLTLELEQGRIVTDKVFLATNYESGKIGFLSRYLMGSTLTGSFTRQLSKKELGSLGNLQQWGVLSLHGGGATVRLTSDGRICLRNTVEYNRGELLSDQQLDDRRAIHRKSFDQRFSQLADVAFEYSWSGVEGISRNSTNFFGRQRNNIYLAGGYNGSGVSRGTAFGTALADYASGSKSQLISDCLESEPGKWMPPSPFLDIGAAFKIAARFRGTGLDR